MTEIGWIAIGLLAGGLHFALLRWNTGLYSRPGSVLVGAAVQSVRLLVLAGLLYFSARHGALALLLMALGVLAARPVVMRVVT